MPITARGRADLSEYYTDEPSPEVDWEFVDEVRKACTAIGADEYTTLQEVTPERRTVFATASTSQLFIGWLACRETAPTDRQLYESWTAARTSMRIARQETWGNYWDTDLTDGVAEACIVRSIAFQLSEGRDGPKVCFNSLLRRVYVTVHDCECIICESCGRHGDDTARDFCDGGCGNCLDCCGCSTCAECYGRFSDLTCHECNHCDGCGCSCPSCINCGERGLDVSGGLCDGCTCCQSCCECEDGHSASRGPRLRRKNHNLLKFDAQPGKQKVNTLKRLLGAEIEVSKGYDTPVVRAMLAKWMASVVNDGSLPDSGSEVVTQPAAGDVWVNMIGDITNGLTSPGCAAAVNGKCGLHVHVDAGDLTVWDVKRFVKLYAHVEQAMFDLTDVDPSRCNHYAKPCGSEFVTMMADCSGKGIKSAFLRKHYKAEVSVGQRYYDEASRSYKVYDEKSAKRKEQSLIRNATTHKYNDARYRAVNLHSYFFRGTVEFRHHHGTIDREAITNWGIVCGSVVQWAATHTDADFAKLAIAGRSSKKVLELVVGQKSVIAWMRARWNRDFTQVKLAEILNYDR